MNTVGLLIITHPAIGPALITTVTTILGHLPLTTQAFEVPFDSSPETLLPHASAALRKVDTGAGVLILSDLYGATPANLGAQLAQLDTQTRQISGVNLPMLLRIMNYPELSLADLCLVAISGARSGVIHDHH